MLYHRCTIEKMASQERFELPTHGLEGRCSIQLSYWDVMEGVPGFEPGDKGFADPCLTTWLYSRVWGDRWESNPRMSEPQSDALATSPRPPQIMKFGRGSRNRTHTKGFGDLRSTFKLCPYGSGGGDRTPDLSGMNRTL